MSHARPEVREAKPATKGLARVEFTRYRAVGYWRWDLKDVHAKKDKSKRGNSTLDATAAEEDDDEGICGICRQAFDATCPDCAIPGDDCPPVLGACSHAFHMHCIMKWLDTQNQHQDERKQQCPMCRAEWQFQAE